MIKQEIIEKISKYFKLTNFEAEKIYDDIFAGIIQGVKEDNIADITNLGEFIIKYNNSDIDNKKTVEFLPTLSLEEEINQRSFEESRTFEPSEFMADKITDKTGNLSTEEIKPEIGEDVPATADEDDRLSVEEDIRRKREGKIIIFV